MQQTHANRFPPSRRLAFLGLATAVALAACGNREGQQQGPGGPGGQMPPPEVAVIAVQPVPVSLSTELPGRLEASRVAQVRAQATGILQQRVFTEGSDVKAGQVLYRIDPAPYEAALQSAQAALAQAQAQLAQASALAARYKPLVAAQAVSQQEYDAAVAAEQAAQAQVAAGKAAVRSASINRAYATVVSPISGRIGRSMVTEGALVSAQEGTQLTTVQQINPLYLNITQSVNEVLQLREALAAGKLARAGQAEATRVDIVLEDGRPYGSPGRLLFTDLSVDPATGQVSLRAEVPNPRGLLLPGMYVRARLQQAQIDGAMLVPQQAVTRGSQGDSVLVVAPDGQVMPRPVKIEGVKDGQWIVTDGLAAGEQVMVEGAMKLMFGAKVVKPVPWSPSQGAAGAGHGPGAAGAGASASPSHQAASAASAAPTTADAASAPAAAASR
ncbi:MAG: efflux RND transporter periplasmic adaptor subunit [Burkholderiales bacterium]|nr:efflux RND transporter periplasmic adaptor subunit [Burkholderiales bacterium]